MIETRGEKPKEKAKNSKKKGAKKEGEFETSQPWISRAWKLFRRCWSGSLFLSLVLLASLDQGPATLTVVSNLCDLQDVCFYMIWKAVSHLSILLEFGTFFFPQ